VPVNDQVKIVLQGRLTAYTAAPVWRSALDTLRRYPNRSVVVDASGLAYADAVGIALLFDLTRSERPANATVEIRDLAPNLANLLRGYDPAQFVSTVASRPSEGLLERLGRLLAHRIDEAKQVADFAGECTASLARTLARRAQVQWGDMLDFATEAGANAVPIALLIGFLTGVIVAFQMAVVARNYGAVTYVVDGVAIAMLREVGPLMTAIVFAGRTGAAYAAQIGTQKVNEEVNAITTFGLRPVQFLVLPRLVASMLVLPLLSVLADVSGLFGGALVLTTFDISFTEFYTRTVAAVDLSDFVLGLTKAGVFGLAIAAVGCQRGLSTSGGATSVGLSTTSAVVSSIVLIIVIDGVFAAFST
jgi:phospholipid/cholesterol/gamma-HCH transport system permease protein